MAREADEVEALPGGGLTVPGSIEEKTKRGRTRMREDASQRNECLQFWRGNQYVYRNAKDNLLVSQSTVTNPDGSGKPRHRIRLNRNLISDIVAHEVSAATQRVPGYEVTASTSDPQDIAAASLAAKVARYGYDKWGIRAITERVVTYAVVADEGFAWPYWDSSIPPFVDDGEGGVIGEGEIRIAVFGPNEAYWEPGVDFTESTWHCVEQARTLESVYQQAGYIGGKLDPDAQSDDSPSSQKRETAQARLVLVTEYLERPCPKYPAGRWLTIANGKQILPERPYPCTDHMGRPVDEPVLHRLSYTTDPDNDRDMGLVRHLVDLQRVINDCGNKISEWKNIALNPQVVIQNGEFKQRLNDEPGAVYHAVGTGQINWRPVPPVPRELFDLKESAEADMARIAAQNEIPSQVESGKGIVALQERDASRRASFLGNLAEFHSRLMRHLLYLVQRHYTEPRLLSIQSPEEPDLIQDFMGAQLYGQADVSVSPGTLEPISRAAQEERIMRFAEQGWVDPQAAMAAIEAGRSDVFLQSYKKDYQHARQIIQKIKDGPEVLFNQPPRPPLPNEQPIDFQTGQPLLQVPGWMPRPFDNVPLQKSVFEDWMKTTDYDMLPPESKEAANLYYSALLQLEQQKKMEQAMQQQQMAEGLGMGNAARPQGPPPLPDQPKPDQEA